MTHSYLRTDLAIGDRVRLTNVDERYSRPSGSRGKIVKITDDSFWPYRVLWDSDGYESSWAGPHLEKLPVLDQILEAIKEA